VRLPAYERTKPSCVEWLGDVPEHWTVVPFKHCCRRFAIYGANMSSDDYVPDGVRFLRTTDIDELGQLQPEGVFIEPEQAREYLLKNEDILLSRSGTLGRAFVYRSEIHPACAYAGYLVRFVPNARLNARFLFHFTKSIAFTDWLQTQIIASTIGNVNGQKYAQCPLPLPEREEQDSIAAFLDRETGRVDRLVMKKLEIIERLKEKRSALISRTVTRGLPPSAAHAAGVPGCPRLKSSGLDWLGDIPAHWEVRKFSREVAIAEGQVNPEKEPFASMLLIGPEHVESGTGRLLQRATAADQAAESGKYLSRKGDVIYSKIRPALRKLVIAPEDCLCSADMYPLRARTKLDNRFLAWFLLSEGFSGWSVLESDRVAMPKINRDTLNGLRMPIPPLAEQVAIAAFLDSQTAKLDALSGKVEEAVERLREYRTALITAAVTGKVDVRNEAYA
jgi:type I restriction enzyme S subunit